MRDQPTATSCGLALIDEFVARPVDLLLSPGPAAARAIVHKPKIPVVAVALPAVQSDPDLFQSLARPGGSLTGFAAFGEETSGNSRCSRMPAKLP
jgi:putative tryptophan/tyrosine transport system substrate-binding protein